MQKKKQENAEVIQKQQELDQKFKSKVKVG
jgi:hypothetical protein